VQYLDKSTFARAVIFDSKYRNLLASGSTSVDNVYWANYVTKWENVNSSHNTGLEIQLKKRINKTEIASNFTHQSLVNQGSIQVLNKARNYGNFDINYFFDDKFDLGMGFLFTSSRRTYSPDYVKTHTPGYSVFRLHTSYKFSDQLRGIGSLENAFNKNYYQIYGYNTTGRGIYATLQYQPK
jgi:vitamin B12 transporter